MTKEETFTRTEKVFREVFEIPDLKIKSEMVADDVEGWDSMAHINLIYALEKEFGIKFKTSEIGGIKNVGLFIETILQKTP